MLENRGMTITIDLSAAKLQRAASILGQIATLQTELEAVFSGKDTNVHPKSGRKATTPSSDNPFRSKTTRKMVEVLRGAGNDGITAIDVAKAVKVKSGIAHSFLSKNAGRNGILRVAPGRYAFTE